MSNIRRTHAPAAARTVTTLAVSLALGACALAPEDPAPPEAPVERARVVRYAVEPGDRLGLIARELTGDAELWRAIADLNGITDPRRLAVGQILEIPVALIPDADRETRLAASVPMPAEAEDEDTEAARAEEDDTGTDDVGVRQAQGEGGALSRARSGPVVVSAVRTREAFDLSPLDGTGTAAAAGSRFVRVVGSYTPKGVYLQPAVQSRVLMRVTPGTVLALERDVQGWYRVSTSAGPGYLRGEDAQIVDPKAADGAR